MAYKRKVKQDWTREQAEAFAGALRGLGVKHGFSNETLAEVFGVSDPRFNVWIDPDNKAMPLVPTYELVLLAAEMPIVFERLVERRQAFLGKLFEKKDPRGRKPKTHAEFRQSVHS